MAAMLRLKRAKNLEMIYDAPAGMTVTVYIDVPGVDAAGAPQTGATQGGVASIPAATLEFPATLGKQTFTLSLDDLYFTLIRFRVTSTARVILYAGIFRCLDIGESFFGPAEFYDSMVLNIGS